MSESSLPPFHPQRAIHRLRRPQPLRPPTSPKGLLSRVLRRLRRSRPGPEIQDRTEAPAAGLEARAEGEILAYLEGQREALERAARLHEKAERLEASGTPSESAENRASRARVEVEEGLAPLRARFVGAAQQDAPSGTSGAEAGAAFDRAARRLFPAT